MSIPSGHGMSLNHQASNDSNNLIDAVSAVLVYPFSNCRSHPESRSNRSTMLMFRALILQ